MKKTNYFTPIQLLNFIFFLYLIPQFSYARNTVPDIEIVAKDTVIGTLDCYAYDIFLEAYIQDVCAIGETKWTYLLINSDYGDTIQYSHNYLPVPGEGIAGEENFDILSEMISARMKIIEPLGIGNYILFWNVGNECGDLGTKEQIIKIVDNTAPTLVLIDTFYKSNHVGFVEKAKKFDKGEFENQGISSFDNCTSKNDLCFTFTPILPELWKDPNPNTPVNEWEKQFADYGFNLFDSNTGKYVDDKPPFLKFFTKIAHKWYRTEKTSERYWDCGYDLHVLKIEVQKIYIWDKFLQGNEFYQSDNSVDSVVIITYCNEPPSVVYGTVKSYSSEIPVNDMSITLTHDEGVYHGKTGSDGFYEIECNPHYIYNVICEKDDDNLNGVTTLDILMIHKHLLGLKPFNNLFQHIVADVNNSLSVTAADALEIKKVILGLKERFVRKSWIGIEKDFEFKNTSDLYSEFDMASKPIINSFYEVYQLDFKVLKTGDVNLNANPLIGRNESKIKLNVKDFEVSGNIRYEIPVYSDGINELAGLQFALDLSNFSYFDIKSGKLFIEASDYNLKDNIFLFSYTNVNSLNLEKDEVLFTIIIEPNQTTRLSNILYFSQKTLQPEAYTGNDISELMLEFRNDEFKVYQNEPNPFSDETEIRFYLPDEKEFEFTVFDINGREIYNQKSSGNKGLNVLDLDNGIFKSSGTYFYKLIAGNNTDIKKMVFLR